MNDTDTDTARLEMEMPISSWNDVCGFMVLSPEEKKAIEDKPTTVVGDGYISFNSVKHE
tara:strand:+ start:1327 stop:1503 length:177 start_codon:yes stop_codon:yes gene_type:complete